MLQLKIHVIENERSSNILCMIAIKTAVQAKGSTFKVPLTRHFHKENSKELIYSTIRLNIAINKLTTSKAPMILNLDFVVKPSKVFSKSYLFMIATEGMR